MPVVCVFFWGGVVVVVGVVLVYMVPLFVFCRSVLLVPLLEFLK